MIGLWVKTDARGSPGAAVRMKVKDVTKDINRQVASRGVRSVNAIRNAELDVLKGKRSGKVYRKYPYKTSYTASAPGEAPAKRSGSLRLHWRGNVKCNNNSSGGIKVSAVLESQEDYAGYLENGTRRMKGARPFLDKIKEKAIPEIKKIYSGPYS